MAHRQQLTNALFSVLPGSGTHVQGQTEFRVYAGAPSGGLGVYCWVQLALRLNCAMSTRAVQMPPPHAARLPLLPLLYLLIVFLPASLLPCPVWGWRGCHLLPSPTFPCHPFLLASLHWLPLECASLLEVGP